MGTNEEKIIGILVAQNAALMGLLWNYATTNYVDIEKLIRSIQDFSEKSRPSISEGAMEALNSEIKKIVDMIKPLQVEQYTNCPV